MPGLFSEFTFEGNPPRSVPVRALRICQSEFAHTLLTINTDYDPLISKRLEEGTPVTGRWGWRPKNIKNFFGYVHHTEPIVISRPDSNLYQQQVKVVCLSASYSMKAALRQSWQQRSSSSIAREIIDSFRLSASVADSKDILPSLTSSGQTAWQVLVSLARNLGWTVFSENTEVIFRDPLADLDTQMKKAAVLISDMKGQTIDSDANVRQFFAVDGQLVNPDVTKASRTMSGLDPYTLTEFSISDANDTADPLGRITTTPMFERYVTSAANSLGEAIAKLNTEQVNNRWSIRATADVSGNPRVGPGMLAYFDGIPRRERGFWYVIEADHYYDDSGYWMRLSLGRDARFANAPRPSLDLRRVVRARNDPFGERRSRVPASVLINNVWRAEYGAQRAV